MKQRSRICYSASQRALIWERWRKGETIHQIAGLFDVATFQMSAARFCTCGSSASMEKQMRLRGMPRARGQGRLMHQRLQRDR